MVDSGDKRLSDWLHKFELHKRAYLYGGLFIYLLLNGLINATSVIMEDGRDGTRQIQIWEPFAWELTSALSVMLILPVVFRFFGRYPVRFSHIKRQIAVHILVSLMFSLAHVVLMVSMREAIYWFEGGNYDFSPWLREFWYEYRKDAWGYVFWLLFYQIVSALYRRLKGEASLIKQQDNAIGDSDNRQRSAQEDCPEHVIVRKLDKEFLVKIDEVDYLESAGNYVNLHQHGRIYPLRGTLGNTLQRIESRGFSRVHRSYGVNHRAIDNIQYTASGDGTITLKSGQQLPISRRYKFEFKDALR